MSQKTTTVVLDSAAREVAEVAAKPPFLFEMPPAQGRETLNQLQSNPIPKPDVDMQELMVPGGPSGQVPVRIVRPKNAQGALPVVVYLHGAGWVFGDANTHDRLIRELCVLSGAAIVFPEYSRSPEARYPVALEECFAVAAWAAEHGGEHNLNGARMAVAGDSVGGNLATVLTMLAKQRGGPRFLEQVLFYPVTDANFDTDSYHEFAEGFYLDRQQMMWYWDQYLPDEQQRTDPTASPLRASVDDLRGLPPTLIITDEADVLRDEGEAYASKLRTAGVPVVEVRYQGMIHDFVMLNSLAGTGPARAAIAQAGAFLRGALEAY
ncbi:alpha/beta hydrolase [Rugosimonospora africana]|uniref:Esterase n=1 Tax=Rugosimonospora africana TaxID=556532 RepID=A0A8J3VN83_9ACTN|nr:alpha/beta hydrolase [Rugosimonospora africana]GIH12685.1 esterase [Rugosimonospora africana]